MKPPPPRLPAAGCVTCRANATAIAASTALPPRFMISTPTRDATSFVDATMPWRPRTGSRAGAGATEALMNTRMRMTRPSLRSVFMIVSSEQVGRVELLLDALAEGVERRSGRLLIHDSDSAVGDARLPRTVKNAKFFRDLRWQHARGE